MARLKALKPDDSMNSLQRMSLPTCPNPSGFALFPLWALFAGLTVQTRAQSTDHPATINQDIEIDGNARAQAFPHFWERMFGSGRAVLTLRESYRNDLRAVRDVTGLEYVRFHAIFHDETGRYDEDEHGAPVYNFSYIDQIYDGLVERTRYGHSSR